MDLFWLDKIIFNFILNNYFNISIAALITTFLGCGYYKSNIKGGKRR